MKRGNFCLILGIFKGKSSYFVLPIAYVPYFFYISPKKGLKKL